MSERTETVGIVGGGSVAHALAAAFQSGPVLVWARRFEAAESVAAHSVAVPQRDLGGLAGCDIILVAVSDGAIPEVAERLADELPSFTGAMMHTSGAFTGSEALAVFAGTGVALGSLHPLVAVSPHAPAAPDVFQGMPFAVEGDSRATSLAAGLVAEAGGFEVQVAGEDKARYHALATMVATGVVTLVDRAAEAMVPMGSDPERADAFRRAYAELAKSAVRNVTSAPGADVLTGAIARGDHELVVRHLDALRDTVTADLYRAVAANARLMLDQAEGAN